MMRLMLKNNSLWNKKTISNFASRTQQCRNAHFSSHHFQEAGVGKYLVILTPIAVGTSVALYAKSNPDFRKTLNDSIPGIEPVLKVVLQEEGNAVSEATKPIKNAAQKVIDAKDTVVGYFSDDKPVDKAISAKSVSNKADVSSSVSPPPLPSITAPKPTKPTPEHSKKSEQIVAKPVEIKPAESIKLPPVLSQPLPQTLADLEKDVEVATQIAIKEYNNAVKIAKEYAEDVKNVVDRVIEHSDHSLWTVLKNKTAARDTAIESAERTAQAAREHIRQLEQHVRKVGKNVPADIVEKTQRNINVVHDQLNKAKDTLYDAKDSAKLSETYWKKVEEARHYFNEQVGALFNGVDLTSKNLNLSKDLDLFIMHAHSHVLAYQKELQKMHAEGETRLRRALDALKQNLNIENQKKILRIQAESEAKLRQQLKHQTEAHTDHLQDALGEKEKEFCRIFERELNEKVSVEQSAYKLQLATMLGKLKGMDEALKARTDADRQVHQSQALWSACSALWASMRTVDTSQPWQKQLRPLRTEVEAVRNASEQDELVKFVLDGLPEIAKTRGVYPENAIRERFMKVEQMARQFALVPEKNATLVTYALSYLQSLLIIQPKELISKAELNDEPIDFSQLNTFEILNRTRYYVDRGNFGQALRYANLLKGASRNVASDWINETKLLLETQQAINVLLAHAATSGLAFL